MYICDLCHACIGPDKHPTKVVVETREVVYPERFAERVTEDWEGRERTETVMIDKGGKGWEIVKEISVCKSCLGEKDED